MSLLSALTSISKPMNTSSKSSVSSKNASGLSMGSNSIACGSCGGGSYGYSGAGSLAIVDVNVNIDIDINLSATRSYSCGLKCYGWCCDKHTTYIFIEYINGYTLEEYVLKNHPIPEKELSEIIEDLIKSLASIHEIGIIHRDLKLENVMFDKESNKWKLIDFGLSFSFSSLNDGSKCFTQCGSKGYIPPEIKLGGQCGRKSDIWTFGCLVIKMLGGELEENEMQIDGASVNNNKPNIWIPKIPPQLIIHFYLKGNMLYLLQRGHKRWMDITQKKMGIKVEGKTFTFEDNDNQEPFELGIVPDGTVELIFKKHLINH
ncbi:hypothetical protein ACTFIR_005351 [Dictyostelium discoideum]